MPLQIQGMMRKLKCVVKLFFPIERIQVTDLEVYCDC